MQSVPQTETSRQNVRLLTTRQAAAYLGVSASTIRRLAYSGELPVVQAFKYWRFDLEDLDTFVTRTKVLI